MKIGRVRPELRAEVRAYMRLVRLTGLALLALGGGLVVWPRLSGQWLMAGPVPLQWIGFGLVGAAWIIFAFVIVRRTRFYRARIAEMAREADSDRAAR
ncbi:hypothetical protein [Erythrobacter aurantius]|uniref:hypothetical protein n=1 Tax=Erythrobacter aurantius TaxID=2909249 RepID=UPI00207A6D68|nr:hypothetical protein [Erythrobacter aurantius]